MVNRSKSRGQLEAEKTALKNYLLGNEDIFTTSRSDEDVSRPDDDGKGGGGGGGRGGPLFKPGPEQGKYRGKMGTPSRSAAAPFGLGRPGVSGGQQRLLRRSGGGRNMSFQHKGTPDKITHVSGEDDDISRKMAYNRFKVKTMGRDGQMSDGQRRRVGNALEEEFQGFLTERHGRKQQSRQENLAGLKMVTDLVGKFSGKVDPETGQEYKLTDIIGFGMQLVSPEVKDRMNLGNVEQFAGEIGMLSRGITEQQHYAKTQRGAGAGGGMQSSQQAMGMFTNLVGQGFNEQEALDALKDFGLENIDDKTFIQSYRKSANIMRQKALAKNETEQAKLSFQLIREQQKMKDQIAKELGVYEAKKIIDQKYDTKTAKPNLAKKQEVFNHFSDLFQQINEMKSSGGDPAQLGQQINDEIAAIVSKWPEKEALQVLEMIAVQNGQTVEELLRM